jgi:hypothetical protein
LPTAKKLPEKQELSLCLGFQGSIDEEGRAECDVNWARRRHNIEIKWLCRVPQRPVDSLTNTSKPILISKSTRGWRHSLGSDDHP